MDDKIKELDAILAHLIGHNKNHAKEITELAEKALALGKTSVHEELLRGLDEMNTSNDTLTRALNDLREE